MNKEFKMMVVERDNVMYEYQVYLPRNSYTNNLFYYCEIYRRFSKNTGRVLVGYTPYLPLSRLITHLKKLQGEKYEELIRYLQELAHVEWNIKLNVLKNR